MNKNVCVDCGVEISKGANRCRSCAAKARWRDPDFRRKNKEARAESEYLQRQSDAAQKRWNKKDYRRKQKRSRSDPVYRTKMSRIAKRLWENPQYRDSQSKASTRLWEDSEYRQKVHDACEDPETKRKHAEGISRSLKKRWKDPEYRRKMTDMANDLWENSEYRSRHAQAMSDPEYLQRQSNDSRERWKDPEYRQRMSEVLSEAMSRPEYRQLRSRIAKDMWSDPDYRRAVRERWEDPEFRERWAASLQMALQSPTQPEESLMKALDGFAISYKFQYLLPGDTRPYDFYIPDANLLIEYDGWFWHKSDWAKDHGLHERDAEKDALATEHGYGLLRISEREMEQKGAQAIVESQILPLL